MARRPVTNGHQSSHQDAASRLSIEQQNAIDLLIQGKPDHEVAAAVAQAPHQGLDGLRLIARGLEWTDKLE